MIPTVVKRMKLLPLAIAITFLGILLQGCTKIEKTTMGGDLIPAVDNINTFDTILTVISNNYIPDDSTRLTQGADHMVGGIANDPIFGTSKATLFFQMKPFLFPFEFTDSVKFFDSAVLVLQYSGHYGDSMAPLTLNLYEVDRKLYPDTSITPIYTINPDLGVNRSRFWGQKTMRANQYKDTIDIKRGDSVYRRVNNELRIPLNQFLAKALFEGDSATVYGSDSIFNSYMPGFALEAQGIPNAIHYFGVSTGSEIQFYYRAKKDTTQDTLMRAYGMTFTSGHAIKFERDRSGAEINSFLTQDPDRGVEQIYIDGTPGAMASLKIPGIQTLTNRVLHRVDLRVVELAPNTGATEQLIAPRALYLDAESIDEPGNFKGIPYDLSPFGRYFCYPQAGVDFSYFGGIAAKRQINGGTHVEYTFNITRYVQSVITRNEPFYNLRLSAPYYMYYKDCVSPSVSFPSQVFPFLAGNSFINNVGESRVRVAGGNHPDSRLRMQVRVIYSKL